MDYLCYGALKVGFVGNSLRFVAAGSAQSFNAAHQVLRINGLHHYARCARVYGVALKAGVVAAGYYQHVRAVLLFHFQAAYYLHRVAERHFRFKHSYVRSLRLYGAEHRVSVAAAGYRVHSCPFESACPCHSAVRRVASDKYFDLAVHDFSSCILSVYSPVTLIRAAQPIYGTL